MAKIIAFYNNKGGVAKTTTATNIAGVLSLENKKTLLIDGDPQGHASLTFGVDISAQVLSALAGKTLFISRHLLISKIRLVTAYLLHDTTCEIWVLKNFRGSAPLCAEKNCPYFWHQRQVFILRGIV